MASKILVFALLCVLNQLISTSQGRVEKREENMLSFDEQLEVIETSSFFSKMSEDTNSGNPPRAKVTKLKANKISSPIRDKIQQVEALEPSNSRDKSQDQDISQAEIKRFSNKDSQCQVHSHRRILTPTMTATFIPESLDDVTARITTDQKLSKVDLSTTPIRCQANNELIVKHCFGECKPVYVSLSSAYAYCTDCKTLPQIPIRWDESISCGSCYHETNPIGYILVLGTCTPCPFHCKTCTSSHSCLSCWDGQAPVGSVIKYCPKTNTGCGPGCSICSSQDPSLCLACQASFTLTEGRECLACGSWSSFNPGFYLYNQISTIPTITLCNRCLPACKVCNNRFTCITCYPGFYRDSDGSCKPCDVTKNCLTCDAASPGICLTCDTSSIHKYLDDITSACVECNLPGEFFNSIRCSRCDPTCFTCTGAGSTSCNQCYPGNYLKEAGLGYTCDLCGDGTGFYRSGLYCLPCHPDCLSCFGPSLTSCTSCRLSQTSYPYHNLYLQGTSCVACDTNSNNYIWTGSNCQLCDPQCSGCIGMPSYCIACSNPAITPAAGNCLCDPSCATCGPSPNQCISCPSGKFLDPSTHTCTSCTQPGYYQNWSYQQCLPCPLNCMECNENGCTTCNANHYVFGTDCLVCPNPNNSNEPACTDCPTAGQAFDPDNAPPGCVNCPSPGKFVNSNLCSDCPDNCDVCTSATDCTQCASGFTKYQVDGRCDYCSGPGVYYNSASTLCEPCSSNCLECSSSMTCTMCYSPYLLIGGTTCGLCNMDGHIGSGPYCVECTSNCKTCQSSNQCSVCLPGKFRYPDGTCGSCAETTNYISGTHCLTCAPTCATCSGTSTTCTTCPPGKNLDITNACITCSPNTFFDPVAKICQPCSSNCNVCTSAISCTQCASSPYLYYLLDGYCTQCNNDGKVLIAGVCHHCNLNCLACSGSTDTCTKCHAGKYLMMATHVCSNACPPGNYILANPNGFFECHPCDTTRCATCASSPSNCLTCLDSNLPEGGVCYPLCDPACINCVHGVCQTCSEGFFLQSDNTCAPCDSLCKTCQTSASTCLSCHAGMFITQSNSCTGCTTPGYIVVGGQCVECNKDCQTCIDSVDKCTSCKDGKTLVNNKCELRISKLTLVSASFQSSSISVLATFSATVSALAPNQVKVGLYADSSDNLRKAMLEAVPSSYLSSLKPTSSEVEIKKIEASGSGLRFELVITGEVKDQTLVFAFGKLDAISQADDPTSTYVEHFLIVDKVSVFSTGFDKNVAEAKEATTAAVGSVTSVLMVASAPQAFILMKIFQNLDFYVYLNCLLPSNFVAMLNMMTSTFFDFLPNFVEPLVLDDVPSIKPKFAEFGQQVNIFTSLGTLVTSLIIVGALKTFLALVALIVRKLRNNKESFMDKANSWIDLSIFYGLVESNHLDVILALIVFVAEQSRLEMPMWSSVLTKLMAGLIFSAMLILYSLMFLMVKKIVKKQQAQETEKTAKPQSPEIENKQIAPTEKIKKGYFEFLVEDKTKRGNFFQNHFNLIQLLKDIVFAGLLYVGYSQPVIIISALGITQCGFIWAIVKYRPYSVKWQNYQLIITQGLYLVLDAAFTILAAMPSEGYEKSRYYFIGYPLIGLVISLILVSFGFAGYQSYLTIKELIQNMKKKKELSKVNPDPETKKQKVETNDSNLELNSPETPEKREVGPEKVSDIKGIPIRKHRLPGRPQASRSRNQSNVKKQVPVTGNELEHLQPIKVSKVKSSKTGVTAESPDNDLYL